MQRVVIKNRPKQTVKITNNIAVAGEMVLQQKTITENGEYTADSGYAGFSKVTVEVDTTKAYEQGKKAEYDKFWDAYQDNGNRSDYQMAFAGYGWNDETFKPKYDINAKDLATGFRKSRITDLAGALNSQGVKLNTEGCTSFLQCFQDSRVTHIPEIDARSATNMSYAFYSGKLKRIDKVKVSATTPFNNTFVWETEYIMLEGEIGQNGFAAVGALPKECLLSIVNCLSTTTSGLSVTLGKNAVNKAFETSEGANDGSNSQEWQTLVDSKKNWTINLL